MAVCNPKAARLQEAGAGGPSAPQGIAEPGREAGR